MLSPIDVTINGLKGNVNTIHLAEENIKKEVVNKDCTYYALTLAVEDFVEAKEGVHLHIHTQMEPKRMLALYMFNDWWTRPAFIDSFTQIPNRTQVLVMEEEDGYEAMLPLVSQSFKAEFKDTDKNELCLRLFSGMEELKLENVPFLLCAKADKASEAIHKAVEEMAKMFDVPLKENRKYPEFLKYLGWCSWDAFYRDVDDKGIEAKAMELKEKGIPVRWFLVDDGWMSSEDMKLAAYEENKEKFKDGFKDLFERLKETTSLSWFGVWHAVCGYWEGLVKDSELAKKNPTIEGEDGRIYPDPFDAEDFYRNWYIYLKEVVIDFVKVDGESSVAQFFQKRIEGPTAAKELLQTIEEASKVLDENVINCMGMAMESIVARSSTAVSRNSDDFVPAKGMEGFKEHLLQNAYNNLYHNRIYVSDWDMFWTKQEDAKMHALLRATSGGPIYFSDRVDETRKEIVEPLVYEDGEILRLERSLLPTEDCIVNDPFKEGVLKLHNYGLSAHCKVGVALMFNLTDAKQSYSFQVDEIKELDKEKEYCIYDCHAHKVVKKCEGELEKDSYQYYLFAPMGRNMACFGRIDKYVGFTAISQWKEEENYDCIKVKEAGPIAWYTEKKVKSVCINGEEVNQYLKEENHFYTLDLPIDGTCEIEITYA
ncbi:MAG: alpha-galactosidase [Solobacterium sp.]|nr:alpha-galactosidase [Solobacterium sp.]